jgi:hypothetical protein
MTQPPQEVQGAPPYDPGNPMALTKMPYMFTTSNLSTGDVLLTIRVGGCTLSWQWEADQVDQAIMMLQAARKGANKSGLIIPGKPLIVPQANGGRPVRDDPQA